MNQDRTALKTEKKLEAEREQILLTLGRLRKTLRSEVDPDIDEGDPNFVEHEKVAVLVQSLERKLASINHALRQAQKGMYGICERCEEPIDPARLEAMPETTFCLKCKMIAEQRVRARTIVSLV